MSLGVSQFWVLKCITEKSASPGWNHITTTSSPWSGKCQVCTIHLIWSIRHTSAAFCVCLFGCFTDSLCSVLQWAARCWASPAPGRPGEMQPFDKIPDLTGHLKLAEDGAIISVRHSAVTVGPGDRLSPTDMLNDCWFCFQLWGHFVLWSSYCQ